MKLRLSDISEKSKYIALAWDLLKIEKKISDAVASK